MKKLIFVTSLVLLPLFFTACSNTNIEKNLLVDKTKKEVLEILFEKSPRTLNGDLNISIQENNGSYSNFYYKTISDALKSKPLMDADVWDVDKRKSFSFSIFQKVTAVLLHFKDGKVVKYEIVIWKMT